MPRHRPSCRQIEILLVSLLTLLLAIAAPLPALAQQTAPSMVPAVSGSMAGAPEPGAPDSGAPARTVLRFLTDIDYPPFNYADEDGTLTGFNIELARAVCVELEVTCEIHAVDWNELLPALDRGDADAVVASIAATPSTLPFADFTDRYYFMAAHFAVRRDGPKLDISTVGLESRRIAVVRASAHEAYLKAFFPDSQAVAYGSQQEARDALMKGEVDALFGDGLALAFWVNGASSKGCCELSGGAFHDEAYFGDGVGIAVRKGDMKLRRLIDKAIGRVKVSGRYEEMLLRYFPVRLF